MPKYCINCGKQGGFFDFDIRYRNLPISNKKLLCSNCYNEIFTKENVEYQKIMQWKNSVLRLFYEGTLKQLCHEQGIITMEKRWTTAVSRRGTRYKRQYNYYFTYEELISKLIRNVSLGKLLDFAKKKNIPVREIELEIDKFYTEKKFIENPNISKVNNELYQKILEKIEQFKPLLPFYPNELAYQLDLGRYLIQYFPNTKLEEQRSSARPDIIIDNIAIEIKGPTYEEGLRSIADKCLRYPLYFEKGLIIVLFDVKVTNRYIEDWKIGLINKYPNTTIIKK